MTQSQLDHSVAQATGEAITVVRRIGFSLLTPIDTESDAAARWLQDAHRRQSTCPNRLTPYMRAASHAG